MRRYEQPLPQGLHLSEPPNHWLPKQLFHWLWEWKVVSVAVKVSAMEAPLVEHDPA